MEKQSIKIIQNADYAIKVMHEAGRWLEESGKNPSQWWHPSNMNQAFLFKHAEPDEFYAALIEDMPAAAMVLQESERNQSWAYIDKQRKQKALYIHWLCISRRFAGRHLPGVMVRFAKQIATGRGFAVLRLDTNAGEFKLKKIYETLGFDLRGVQEETAFYETRL
ncbi:MAG: GNAT family N-acetyltransferase [Patescibacteria group bacterium]